MPQDFSRQNLRGRNFKGQDLTGADFSHADIRGANFTNAILRGANFSDANAGLQSYTKFFSIVVIIVLSAFLGYTSAIASLAVASFFENEFIEQYTIVPGILGIGLLGSFFITSIRQGYWPALKILALGIAIFGPIITIGDFIIRRNEIYASSENGIFAALASVLFTGGIAATIALLTTGVIAVVGITYAAIVGIVGLPIAISTVLVLAGTTIGLGRVSFIAADDNLALAISVTTVAAMILTSSYIGWRGLKGDEKFPLTRTIAMSIASRGGTSFQSADLTDANLEQATLNNTDFRNATLIRINWFQAKEFDRACLEDTYLDSPNIRELVTNKNARDKNFDCLNLIGINLQGANLADASFMGADLSEANLQDADLSRAQLVQTQLDQTDLTGATLTGATIEDWGITSSTKLHWVSCDYVFMRVPTKNDPNRRRKPDNWEENFADGDFADFITPIVKTLDLYHNQDVDPRAIAVAYRNLAENHPEAALGIVAMEIRGKNKDKFVLRVETSEEANHSELNAEYIRDYNQIKSLPRESLLLLLAERDNHISRLESTISNALSASMVAPETFENSVPRRQSKRVILNFGAGDFDTGFPAITAQIFADTNRLFANSQGQLPPNPELPRLYYRWQAVHYAISGIRLPKYNPHPVSSGNKKQLRQLEDELRNCLNTWLDSEFFRAMEQELRDNLTKSEEVQCIIQTENIHLRRLPWHLWDLFESYRKAEVALSTPVYQRVDRNPSPRNRVRILGVLGDSTGINIIKDQQLLEEYDAETVFLVESPRTELLSHLWDEESWDILSFSGHSSSEWTGKKGWIYINKTDKLELDYLKTALRAAINNGLQLAIFNSCDGLGLASQLGDLQIPQLIVMREPVPDLVAQEFLQNFLKAFAGGKSFYLAVRQAREMLQSLEAECPCATWLPVICQNPAELPPLWSDLQRQ